MGLYEYLSSGFGKAEDLNCAEKILYGANEIYDLGIDKNDLKMAAGFGGGMLAMIVNTYRQEEFGSPKKFKEDFKKKYPAEYDNSNAKTALLAARRRMAVNE